ncbi:MAG: CoA transferase [bacterium]|nr:CoA transferase [bacterium]
MEKLDFEAPLKGIKIIDFGHYYAGPMAGMLLADQGADVIKIERPGSDEHEKPECEIFNRGKKIISLDIKDPNNLEKVTSLIQSADVVIENFHSGVMGKLGLGSDEMIKINPGLLYLSLPGFSSKDKSKASVKAYEGIINASAGIFTGLHMFRSIFGFTPVYTPLPMASVYGAIHGAIAVTMSLYERETTGKGKKIEVPLAGAALSALGGLILKVHKQPNVYNIPPVPGFIIKMIFPILKWYIGKKGKPLEQKILSKLENLLPPLMDSFKCSDGKWFYSLSAENQRLSPLFLKEMGLYDMLLKEGMVEKNIYKAGILPNNVADAGNLSSKWKKIIRKELTEIFAQHSSGYWVERLSKAGIPCSIQRTSEEWLRSSEPAEGYLTVDIDTENHGKLRQPGVLLTLGKTPERYYQPSPAKRISPGEVLPVKAKATGKTNAGNDDVSKDISKGILSGLRVLDLSSVIAGPTCGRTLAEYGAEVIKIDSTSPNSGARVMCWYYIEVGTGKKSILLDLKNKKGMEIFLKLVKTSDIIVHNFRPGTAERIGMDYETLKKHNPGIIYCHLTALVGPKKYAWTERRGYDPILQAATGIMKRYGGNQKPEAHGIASAVDYLTGYSGVLGVALALFKRKRAGAAEGDLVQTSLAQSAQLVQLPFMYTSEKYKSGNEPAGQDVLGEHSLYRAYKARDGWIFIASESESEGARKLAGIPGLEFIPLGNGKEGETRIAFLEQKIRSKKINYWVTEIRRVSVECHRIDSFDDIIKNNIYDIDSGKNKENILAENTYIITRLEHPSGYRVDVPAPCYVRFNGDLLPIPGPAPKAGSNTKEVLRKTGYSDEEIEELFNSGAVSEQLNDKYLP